MTSRTLTTTDVAERLGISRQRAHVILSEGRIAAKRTPGGRFQVEEAALQAYLRSAGNHSPTTGPRVIALVNQKGGVGKTTTTVNLAAELADRGEHVLVVDADPQANATLHLGITPYELKASLYEVMLAPERGASDAIINIAPNLDLLPSKLDLSAVEWELASVFGRERVMKKALVSLLPAYNFVLIDCPPALGLLTLNALMVAREILIPLQVEPFAVYGLGQLQHTINIVQGDNPDLHISGVLCTMYDGRNNLGPAVAEQIREAFGDLVFQTRIPRNIALSAASGAGQPVRLRDPRGSGAEAYSALAEEVIVRGKE